MPNSFFDLDYIIEINEKRVEQYIAGNDKVLGRLPTIIIIYSAIAIFLVPVIQDIVFGSITHWLFYVSFSAFVVAFGFSIYFTIQLIIPKELVNLVNPRRYYSEYRQLYLQRTPVPTEPEMINLLKASYIDELEQAIDTNQEVFERNGSYYYRAVLYGLLSAIPYIICLGFHVVQKDDKVQKVQLVGQPKAISLHTKDTVMAKNTGRWADTPRGNQHVPLRDSGRNTPASPRGDGQVRGDDRTGRTQGCLPGVDNSQVIHSPARRVKQNSDRPSR